MKEMTILSLFDELTDDEQGKKLLKLISESLNNSNFDYEQIVDEFLLEDE